MNATTSRKGSVKKSFEFRYNQILRCMELYVYDADGMFPLVVREPNANKLYHIEKTRSGGLKMSAI